MPIGISPDRPCICGSQVHLCSMVPRLKRLARSQQRKDVAGLLAQVFLAFPSGHTVKTCCCAPRAAHPHQKAARRLPSTRRWIVPTIHVHGTSPKRKVCGLWRGSHCVAPRSVPKGSLQPRASRDEHVAAYIHDLVTKAICTTGGRVRERS